MRAASASSRYCACTALAAACSTASCAGQAVASSAPSIQETAIIHPALRIYKRLYIIPLMDLQHATLGTLLRALLDQLDPAVEQAYRHLHLDYRPRYTPVLRTLMAQGPCRIKDLALACGLSHSALSQTVAAMVRDGWLHTANGDDGRERILQLSPRAQRAMPVLQAQWQATAVAARSLDADLGQSLEQVLRNALVALEQRPFAQRLQDARRR